ncbi:MAG: DUF2474 domain-containing protein [Burkholderiales bacterium]
MARGVHAGGPGRGREWVRRVGWLVALWAGGVAVVAMTAYGLRIVMRWAGLGG